MPFLVCHKVELVSQRNGPGGSAARQGARGDVPAVPEVVSCGRDAHVPAMHSFSFPAMKTFWGEEPHRAELNDLRKEQAALNIAQSKSFLEVVKEPSLRWQLYMLLVLAVTTQLSGIQAVE